MPASPVSPASRLVSAAAALVALAALALQYAAAVDAPMRPEGVAVWWWLAGYFTILTNLGTAVLMSATALGHRLSAAAQAGMILAMLMVGLVYHALLARLWAPEGLVWWADQGLHTAVPLLVLAWWLGFGNRAVGLRDLPSWLIWPAAYGAYALARGALTGFWPYPFLDADLLGWQRVTLNLAGMMAGFGALGLGLIGLARASVR